MVVGCCRGGRFCCGGGDVCNFPADSDVVVVEGVCYLLWVCKSVAVVLEFGGGGSGIAFWGMTSRSTFTCCFGSFLNRCILLMMCFFFSFLISPSSWFLKRVCRVMFLALGSCVGFFNLC